jgi:hypothetical protein
MKRSRSSYEAKSPPSSERQIQYPAITAVQHHLASSGQSSAFSAYFDDALDSTQYLDPLQQFLGSNVEADDAQANTSNQYDTASSSFDGQRKTTQPQQSPPQQSESVRRGIVSYAEPPRLIGAGRTDQYLSGAAASPYSTHRRSYSTTSQRSAFTPLPNPPAAMAESAEARTTPYSPYRCLFADTDAARAHRHMSTRFGRHPYIPPEEDDTIGSVERDRTLNVGRIYDAMICGDRAQDNPGSIAMKRWVTGAHYKSDLVEAFAHKVFDCLLVQVKEGFRGWHHNDYVDDDRKGEKEDREADCAHRLEHIIDALEREKTVCEDVVNSASQIRMFVNAPIAYAQRKVQNRQGNSKRGRAKDTSDPNLRPARRRRTGARQMNRSTVTPNRPMSRDTTPQFQTPVSTGLPYYSTGLSQQVQFSPTPGCLASRQPIQNSAVSMHQVPVGHRQATATAPPITARPYMPPVTTSMATVSPPLVPARSYNAHTTMMPTAQMLPTQMLPLPSTQPYLCHSAPPSPEDGNYPLTASSPEDWPTNDIVDAFDTSVRTPVDPSLSTEDLFLTPEAWSDEVYPVQATDGKSNFDQRQPTTQLSLADIENTAVKPIEAHDEDPGNLFVSNWNSIDGVQPFFFDGTSRDADEQY